MSWWISVAMCSCFFIERYMSLMTIDVTSQWSLLVDSYGLTRRLSFTTTRAWLRSFIIFNLTFFNRPAVNNFLDWDVGSLLMRDDGFKLWKTPEMGDDEWGVDDLYVWETFFAEELKTVVFDPVRPLDPISMGESTKWSPSVPVSLSELRLMLLKCLLLVMAGVARMGSMIITLLERGVRTAEDGSAWLIVATLLVSREGWKVFIPLAKVFGCIVWKWGQYCQPLFWRL